MDRQKTDWKRHLYKTAEITNSCNGLFTIGQIVSVKFINEMHGHAWYLVNDFARVPERFLKSFKTAIANAEKNQ
jgi:hypothetical protein